MVRYSWRVRRIQPIATISSVFLILSFMPYISPYSVPFDTQPWSLIAAATLFVVGVARGRLRLTRSLLLLGLAFTYAIGIYSVAVIFQVRDAVEALRSVALYMSLFMITAASYRMHGLTARWVPLLVSLAWSGAAVLQLLLSPSIMQVIVPRVSTGGYRGLTALAPEPAYYAKVCVALLLLNEFCHVQRRYGWRTYLLILTVNVVQIVASRSGAGLLLLVVFSVLKVGTTLLSRTYSVRRMFLGTLSAVLAICLGVLPFIVVPALSESRAADLIQKASVDASRVVLEDPSIRNRLLTPVLGVYGGLVVSRGLGFALMSDIDEPLPSWVQRTGFKHAWGQGILGGIAEPIYELGLLGILVPIAILRIFAGSVIRAGEHRREVIVSAIVLLVMMVSESLATPYIGYLLGIHLAYACRSIRCHNGSGRTFDIRM